MCGGENGDITTPGGMDATNHCVREWRLRIGQSCRGGESGDSPRTPLPTALTGLSVTFLGLSVDRHGNRGAGACGEGRLVTRNRIRRRFNRPAIFLAVTQLPTPSAIVLTVLAPSPG